MRIRPAVLLEPKNRRRIAWSAAAALFAALILLCVLWLAEAARLKAGVAEWTAQQNAGPVQMQVSDARISGFPLVLRIEFSNVRARLRSGSSVALAAPSLSVRAFPWNLRAWRFSAEQGVSMQLGAANFQAASVAGKTSLRGDGLMTLHLIGQDLSFHRDGPSLAAGTLMLDMQAPQPGQTPDDGRDVHFVLELEQVLAQAPPPLGNNIADLKLGGEVEGAIPQQPWPALLATWRDEGGTLEIRSGHLEWGPMIADGDGTLALDKAMQPIGAFTATISGYKAILETLAASGEIKPMNAKYIGQGLDFLAQPGSDGKRVLRIPVTFQNGGLFLGPAKVSKLPTFTW